MNTSAPAPKPKAAPVVKAPKAAPPVSYTQADVLALVAADLTAAGLGGTVTSDAAKAVLTLTDTEAGPNGPEPVVLTVNVGAPDGVGMCGATASLQQSGTVLYTVPPVTCTRAAARSVCYALVTWWKSP